MQRSSCSRLRASTVPNVLILLISASSFHIVVRETPGEPPRGVEPLRAGSKPAALPLSYGGVDADGGIRPHTGRFLSPVPLRGWGYIRVVWAQRPRRSHSGGGASKLVRQRPGGRAAWQDAALRGEPPGGHAARSPWRSASRSAAASA